MKFNHYVQHGIVVLAPQGRLTVENEVQLTAAIRRLHATGQFHIVLSLADVPAIDSCGLGAVVQAYMSTWGRGGMMKIAAAVPRNQRLFEVTALRTVMELYPTVEEAVLSFPSEPSRGERARRAVHAEYRRQAIISRPDESLQGVGDAWSGATGGGIAARYSTR